MPLRGDCRYVHDKYLKGIARKSRIRYEDLFGADMELGRWLRSKNTAVIINSLLFIHAGVSPALLDRDLALSELNNSVRAHIDLPSSQLAFSDLPKFLFGSQGPFWYRGYFEEMEGRYPQAADSDVDRALAQYEASAVVVGHTGVEHVTGLYGNRVIAIDVPVEDLGFLEGLLWEDGRFHRVTGNGDKLPFP
jgi:hypothetical protein